MILWTYSRLSNKCSSNKPYSDYEIDNEDELILDIINGVRPNDNVIGTPKYTDPEKRPTTLSLLEELHAFTTAPLKKHQFEVVYDQPLGTRPNQLSKDNVKIIVESINVTEAYYDGTTIFRFRL
ncbi:9235_t:CDS:2 [Rhizophagus irregularis]|nr:9235_t:CDS:2 [Rhizophagus irregularis]